MKYAKPEVKTIESAALVIQGGAKAGLTYDNAAQTSRSVISAYEADE